MSDKKDYEVLSAIVSAGGEKIWVGGRYVRRGTEKAPQHALRGLSERGLVEVETRSCSPWSFGPKYPPAFRPAAMPLADWHQMHADYSAFDPQRNFRKYSTRSEVVAFITSMGIEHLTFLEATRI